MICLLEKVFGFSYFGVCIFATTAGPLTEERGLPTFRSEQAPTPRHGKPAKYLLSFVTESSTSPGIQDSADFGDLGVSFIATVARFKFTRGFGGPLVFQVCGFCCGFCSV